MNMRKVCRDEFYKTVGPMDVHPSIQPGPWPYTSLWKFTRQPERTPIGKSVGHTDGSSDYFLTSSAMVQS